MGREKCLVCQNWSGCDSNISFFQLPKCLIRREAWLQKLNLLDRKEELFSPKCNHKTVCSAHFSPDQLIRTRLSKTAVPFQHQKQLGVVDKGKIRSQGQDKGTCLNINTTKTTTRFTNLVPVPVVPKNIPIPTTIGIGPSMVMAMAMATSQIVDQTTTKTSPPFLLPNPLGGDCSAAAPVNHHEQVQMLISGDNKCLLCHKLVNQLTIAASKLQAPTINKYIQGLLDLALQNTKVNSFASTSEYRNRILEQLQQCVYCLACIDEIKSIYGLLQQVAQLNQKLSMKRGKILAKIRSVLPMQYCSGNDKRKTTAYLLSTNSTTATERTDKLRQTLIKHLQQEGETPISSFENVNISTTTTTHQTGATTSAPAPATASAEHNLVVRLTPAAKRVRNDQKSNHCRHPSSAVLRSSSCSDKRIEEQTSTTQTPPPNVTIKIENDPSTSTIPPGPDIPGDPDNNDGFLNYQFNEAEMMMEIKTEEEEEPSVESDPLGEEETVPEQPLLPLPPTPSSSKNQSSSSSSCSKTFHCSSCDLITLDESIYKTHIASCTIIYKDNHRNMQLTTTAAATDDECLRRRKKPKIDKSREGKRINTNATCLL